jgi:hypothetical protein
MIVDEDLDHVTLLFVGHVVSLICEPSETRTSREVPEA